MAIRAHGVEAPRLVAPETAAKVAALVADIGLEALGDALAASAPPAVARQHGPLGNVFLRPMHFPQVGSRIVGHKHFYDHVTFVSQGTVACVARHPDGRVESSILSAPAVLFVPKDTLHEFTAIVAPVEAHCVFSLREKDGRVVEEWNGNYEATQARL